MLPLLAGVALASGCGDEEAAPIAPEPASVTWSEPEIRLLESLSVQSLPPTPPQPSNRVADSPAAAELGHRLFFDPGLSRNGQVSCATCHLPERLFTDGRVTSRGIDSTGRNAPTLVGAAHSPWMYWDGRRDSLWAQALAPLETSAEMGSTRTAVIHHVMNDETLRDGYERVFGSDAELADRQHLPANAGPFGSPEEKQAWQGMTARERQSIDEAFANVGKALEAYERLLTPGPSRFDQYVTGLRGSRTTETEAALGDEEIQGLRLFVDAGRTLCLRCHNGPLLTNQSFHDIGTARGRGALPDFGHFLGIQAVLIDPFNCLGAFSDARPEQCRELRFLNKTHVEGAMGKFKTPTLRGLPRTAPYMHDGRFAGLSEVIEHYRRPPTRAGVQEITPLELDDRESRALVAFLTALDGGISAEARWLRAPPAP